MNPLLEKIEDALNDKRWLAVRKTAAEVIEAFESGSDQYDVKVNAAFIGSFTLGPLVDYVIVQAASCGIWLNPYIGGYGKIEQEMLDPKSGLYEFEPEFCFVFPEFGKVVNPEGLINAFCGNCKCHLVFGNYMAVPGWPYHIIKAEQTEEVQKANSVLSRAAEKHPCSQLLDIDGMAAYYGYSRSESPEMLAMARMPYSEGFMSVLSKKIISHVRAAKGLVKKCLVLDCDNTLWGGIIGEDGFDGIAIGPDTPGREYVEFQKAILELYGQGVILAVNSKNNYEDAIRVFREHPHMILKEEHFAGLAINWQDKPSNMQKLADEINIGLDSFVFLDDNPAERAMMRQMLPQVHTPELPANPCLYAKFLRETNDFVRSSLTDEDKKRGQMYAAQRKRSEVQKQFVTLEDYLRSLEMTATIRPAGEGDVKRVSQMTQRTNQFNLTTKRYTESEISEMLESDTWKIFVLGLRDKFGDNGTVGLAIINCSGKRWQVDSFLMSCRVIGRGAEDALVERIFAEAKSDNIKKIFANYIKTAKNSLVEDFWDQAGFEVMSQNAEEAEYCLEVDSFKPARYDYLKVEGL